MTVKAVRKVNTYQAFKFPGYIEDNYPDWLEGVLDGGNFYINTPHGELTAKLGDYILWNEDDEMTVCSPEIFMEKYTLRSK